MPDLRGKGVILTRAADQSAELAAQIESANGRCFLFPSLEIAAAPSEQVQGSLDALPDADINLFVSPNAVRYGLPYCNSGRVGAIGPATAAAIRAAGRDVDIVPDGGYDSEHLLMSDALADIEGQQIRIYRGQRGRELLGSTLAHRGAQVDYVSVYSRRCPDRDPSAVDNLIDDWNAGNVHAWVVMSVETLDNFLGLIGDAGTALAARTPLVSPAARVINEAADRLPGVFATLSDGTSPEELLDAIDAVMVYDD